jgi:MFS family permease
MPADLWNNALVKPPFADNPPVKLNIPAKTVGLVLMILGAIGLIFSLIGLFSIFGLCSGFAGSVCGGTPMIWVLGEIVALVGLALGTYGAYRMFQLDHQGRNLLIYGLAIGVVGGLLNMIGTFVFYSGWVGYAGTFATGAIFGFIISLIVYFIVYYIIVISRFPDEQPLVAVGATGGYPPFGGPPPQYPPQAPPPGQYPPQGPPPPGS